VHPEAFQGKLRLLPQPARALTGAQRRAAPLGLRVSPRARPPAAGRARVVTGPVSPRLASVARPAAASPAAPRGPVAVNCRDKSDFTCLPLNNGYLKPESGAWAILLLETDPGTPARSTYSDTDRCCKNPSARRSLRRRGPRTAGPGLSRGASAVGCPLRRTRCRRSSRSTQPTSRPLVREARRGSVAVPTS